ncbi:hypothetical protein G6F57_022211 [Rhizopus arrhizus]|nr:hypothetical protein G6F57_022211 [Rhizopus arrhizus]
MSGVQIRGRWLCQLKEHHYVPEYFQATYERHLDEGAGVLTIGYARQSYENEAMSIRGRWLWMLKEHYHVPINLKAACERHVEEEADVVTIGYTRKSLKLTVCVVDTSQERCLCLLVAMRLFP